MGLVILAIIGMFSGADEPVVSVLQGTKVEEIANRLHTGNTIVFNSSVSFLTGVFVWFLVVWIPEQRKRTVLKTNLLRRYREFKETVIQNSLWASVGTHESGLVEILANDHEAFQNYFRENRSQRWYDVLNGLEENRDYLNDILVELEILSNEFSYALNNLNVDDDQVHSFFKRMTEHVYKLKNSKIYTHDQVKYLGNFLWEILARWSMISGQADSDIVEDMIDRL